MNPTRWALLPTVLLGSILAGIPSSPEVAAEDSYVPRHGDAIVLFDAGNRDYFDSFLEAKGLNSYPDHVFTLENGVIHVSGTEMGYLITKQEYADYYLHAEFKWGKPRTCLVKARPATAASSITFRVRTKSGLGRLNTRIAKGRPAIST